MINIDSVILIILVITSLLSFGMILINKDIDLIRKDIKELKELIKKK